MHTGKGLDAIAPIAKFHDAPVSKVFLRNRTLFLVSTLSDWLSAFPVIVVDFDKWQFSEQIPVFELWWFHHD